MKTMLDTNIYISWIRERKFEELLLKYGTVKYMSAVVLMELWAGARTNRAKRLLESFQKPYLQAGRVIPLTLKNYILAGQMISGLYPSNKELVSKSGFVNDIHIALNALSVGATLYTKNKTHFKIIKLRLKPLKVVYV